MFRHDAYSRPKRRRWPLIMLGMLAAIVILVAGTAFAARAWYTSQTRPVSGSNDKIQAFVVENGSSVKIIADSLQKDGLVRSQRAFELFVRLNGSAGGLKAGTYSLAPNMSVATLVKTMTEGKQVDKQFTITPGLRLDQIKARMIKAGFISTDIDYAFDKTLYRDRSIIKQIPANGDLEGYLYPDTYNYNDTTTAQDVIGRAIDEMNGAVTDAFMKQYTAKGLTVHDAIIIASIVEKEVSSDEDRQKVAQVFLTRLDAGIMIGADATYVYGAFLTGAEPFPELDSPYNTRKYLGLPPGPISNVTRSTLMALAYPSNTEYVYFVTGDDGKNYFSKTQAEHEAATAAYCKIACAPGYLLPGN